MKQVYQNRLRRMAIALYQPILTRIEVFRATLMWRKGVKACIKKYQDTGAPRFYLLYDSAHHDWAIMTYEPNKKLELSYRVMVRMGKWRTTRYFHNVQDIKDASYYYTPSKWGAIGCDSDNRLRKEKLQQWIQYYMYRVSSPMRKLRIYKKKIGMV